MSEFKKITIESVTNSPLEKVWKAWNNPDDIKSWNFADESWHCPSSEVDLRVGGKFKNRMEAKDGSFGFDFEGIYEEVLLNKKITYTMSDGRKVNNFFEEVDSKTKIRTIFDAETENDPEFQKQGWQSILDNFIKYVESK